MSGGTWDHEDRRLRSLADELRDGRPRHADAQPLDLQAARHAMATTLDVTADLLQHLDHHFAGDDHIEHETAWLIGAQARLRATLDQFLEAPSA